MSTKVWRKGLSYDLDQSSANQAMLMSMDWSAWLSEVGGDTIQSFTFVSDPGLSISDSSNTDTKVFFKVSSVGSPTKGSLLEMTCVVTTAGGQKDPKTIIFKIV